MQYRHDSNLGWKDIEDVYSTRPVTVEHPGNVEYTAGKTSRDVVYDAKSKAPLKDWAEKNKDLDAVKLHMLKTGTQVEWRLKKKRQPALSKASAGPNLPHYQYGSRRRPVQSSQNSRWNPKCFESIQAVTAETELNKRYALREQRQRQIMPSLSPRKAWTRLAKGRLR
ncbi:MAG: hypothetical protein Q9188_004913 [Gyalolechia gomerana]